MIRWKKQFSVEQIDRIIEMAWEDRTPFDAIKYQFGIKEQEVISLMRNNLKPQVLSYGENVYKAERPSTANKEARMLIDLNVVVNEG